MFDGLPVTTAERTVVDLLRDGADGGRLGGLIADAEHRGMIDPERLAGRVARFAARYAMPGAGANCFKYWPRRPRLRGPTGRGSPEHREFDAGLTMTEPCFRHCRAG
jgi:hypothetical protein